MHNVCNKGFHPFYKCNPHHIFIAAIWKAELPYSSQSLTFSGLLFVISMNCNKSLAHFEFSSLAALECSRWRTAMTVRHQYSFFRISVGQFPFQCHFCILALSATTTASILPWNSSHIPTICERHSYWIIFSAYRNSPTERDLHDRAIVTPIVPAVSPSVSTIVPPNCRTYMRPLRKSASKVM